MKSLKKTPMANSDNDESPLFPRRLCRDVHINIDTIKTFFANIDKDSVKTYAQILIEVLLLDLPIPHMRIESIARGVVNMICD
tara:strand:- start:5086 stop:5334 length:249 start_codon:yes stop_codon:yes gene_type:complete